MGFISWRHDPNDPEEPVWQECCPDWESWHVPSQYKQHRKTYSRHHCANMAWEESKYNARLEALCSIMTVRPSQMLQVLSDMNEVSPPWNCSEPTPTCLLCPKSIWILYISRKRLEFAAAKHLRKGFLTGRQLEDLPGSLTQRLPSDCVGFFRRAARGDVRIMTVGKKQKLGVGILGAAAIARKNVKAIGKTTNGIGQSAGLN